MHPKRCLPTLLPVLLSALMLAGCGGGSLLKVMQPVPEDLSHRLTANNRVHFEILKPAPEVRITKFGDFKKVLHDGLKKHSRQTQIKTTSSSRQAHLRVLVNMTEFNPNAYNVNTYGLTSASSRTSFWEFFAYELAINILFCCPPLAVLEVSFLVKNQPAGKIQVKVKPPIRDAADQIVNYVNQHFFRRHSDHNP